MSFVLDFRPFITVTVEEDGPDAGLSAMRFEPTEACRRALRDVRLVYRDRPHGFQLFYQTDPEISPGLRGTIRDRTSFAFLVHLLDPAFFDRYLPDLTAETGSQLYLSNLTPSGNVQTKDTLTVGTFVQPDDGARILPPLFSAPVDVSGSPTPTEVRVLDAFDGSIVSTVPIPTSGGGDRALAPIDLTGSPPGPYVLETDVAGGLSRTIYVDEAVAGSRTLGLVEIHWEKAQDTVPADGLSYFIRFRRR